MRKKLVLISRLFSAWLSMILILTFAVPAQAQGPLNLPELGTMLSPSMTYHPPIMAGMTIHPDNPLKFNFLITTGDNNLEGEAFKKESQKLINYFLATLTVPDDEMWVNLSPYEKDRIIANGLSQTEMGRDMLAQDYILKQFTASLMYPEEQLGEQFWERVYTKTQARFGTMEIPTDTFNKVWIVPEKAVVYVNGTNVFVSESHLKVMMEKDYLALEINRGNTKHGGLGAITQDDIETIRQETKQALRDIILPEIEKEVNENKNFANLRQIYNSMILAIWYKKNLKESVLGKVYMDKNKIQGIDLEDKDVKEIIYNQYVEAFKKGVYNYIKEDYDEATQEIIPRKYFSGGENFQQLKETHIEGNDLPTTIENVKMEIGKGKLQNVAFRADLAMLSDQGEVDTSEIQRIAKDIIPEEYLRYYQVPNLPLYAHEEGPTLYHHLQLMLNIVRNPHPFEDIPLQWQNFISENKNFFEQYVLLHDLGKGVSYLNSEGKAKSYPKHEGISADLMKKDNRLGQSVNNRNLLQEVIRLHGQINEIAKLTDRDDQTQAMNNLLSNIPIDFNKKDVIRFLIAGAFLDLRASIRDGKTAVNRVNDFIVIYSNYFPNGKEFISRGLINSAMLSAQGRENIETLGLDEQKVLDLTAKNKHTNYGVTAVMGHPFTGEGQERINHWDKEISNITHGKFRLNVNDIYAVVGAILGSQTEPITESDFEGIDIEEIRKKVLAKAKPFNIQFTQVSLSAGKDGNLEMRGEVPVEANLSEIRKQMAERGANLEWKTPSDLTKPIPVVVTLGHINEKTLNDLTGEEAKNLAVWIMDHQNIKPFDVIIDRFKIVTYNQCELKSMIKSDEEILFTSSTGGIDFNPDLLDLAEKGNHLKFTLDNHMLNNISENSVQGLSPVIINITPVLDFLPLLGRAEKTNEEQQLSSLN